MKKLLIIPLLLISNILFSQDTLDDIRINPNWVNPDKKLDMIRKDSLVLESNIITDVIDKIIPNWSPPEKIFEQPKEELSEQDVKQLEADIKFMSDLPQSYEELPKEDLKNVLTQIDNKITQLRQEIDKLIKERANQEVIKTKQGTLTVLEKEKSIINLTLTEGELKDENGNLIGENDELKIEQDKLKKYLYLALGGVALLGLIVAVVLQRKRIQVQDVEIEEQLNEINKKNSYLEHAARIIRHDMHSGINTYMPRGINSLEKRLTPEDIQNLKIEGSIKMIKEGLNHTQRVYKSVYEFTNLVKQNVVLNKTMVDIKELIWKYISPNSYSSQVEISDLGQMDVNEILFCNAIENLIKNGLTYNESQEKKIKIYNENEYLIIEDNGVGFSQKDFEKHLKKYAKRADVTGDEKGLGLNICVAILEEHGFKLSCENTTEGTKMKIKIK
jgi:light-regulated signal transduction histidine kinase (bacteriophytochrome)